jgi:hypothetical protein
MYHIHAIIMPYYVLLQTRASRPTTIHHNSLTAHTTPQDKTEIPSNTRALLAGKHVPRKYVNKKAARQAASSKHYARTA